MRKLLLAVLVLIISVCAFIACDSSDNAPKSFDTTSWLTEEKTYHAFFWEDDASDDFSCIFAEKDSYYRLIKHYKTDSIGDYAWSFGGFYNGSPSLYKSNSPTVIYNSVSDAINAGECYDSDRHHLIYMPERNVKMSRANRLSFEDFLDTYVYPYTRGKN